MFICTFKYKPEDVDCALCAEYAHHRCTAESGCPYIAERIEAGVVDYRHPLRPQCGRLHPDFRPQLHRGRGLSGLL